MPDGEPSGSAGSNGSVHLDRLAPHVLLVQHVEDAVGLQDRKHLGVRVDRERRAFAHRQQARDRIDLAIGQDHARDRAVAKLAGLGMKLRRRDQLLAQIGRRIDQEPVLAVGADRDRSLGALKFGMLGSRRPANRTSAIPLRNTATGRGAQDDDAKHDPSPGEFQTILMLTKRFEGGHRRRARFRDRERVTPGGPPASKREAVAAAYLRAAHAYMLISMPTGTSTIFGVFQAILALLAQTGTNFRPRR